MLLAELEIWHTRPATPTRRVALGHLVLPVEPAPGFGGLLLAAVVAAHLPAAGREHSRDIGTLIDQVVAGERIVQPRLSHRFQVDRHGLSVSVHRLVGDGGQVNFQLNPTGRPLAQVLGAIYAVERLDRASRLALHDTLHRAVRWQGPIGPAFVTNLAGSAGAKLSVRANPRAWAMEILGFDFAEFAGTEPGPSRRDVQRRFRNRVRAVHPDLGGSHHAAVTDLDDLNEARKILLE